MARDKVLPAPPVLAIAVESIPVAALASDYAPTSAATATGRETPGTEQKRAVDLTTTNRGGRPDPPAWALR